MKNNKKPKHIQLLEFLNKEEIGIFRDINEFMLKLYPRPNEDDDWELMATEPNHLLNDLIQRCFVSLLRSDNEPWYEIIQKPNWFSTGIKGSITLYGVDYLNQYKTIKSVKCANFRSWMALVISAIVALFTGWPLFSKHNVRPEETKSQSVILKTKSLRPRATNPKAPNKDSL